MNTAGTHHHDKTVIVTSQYVVYCSSGLSHVRSNGLIEGYLIQQITGRCQLFEGRNTSVIGN
jgi:hypothetical protein